MEPTTPSLQPTNSRTRLKSHQPEAASEAPTSTKAPSSADAESSKANAASFGVIIASEVSAEAEANGTTREKKAESEIVDAVMASKRLSRGDSIKQLVMSRSDSMKEFVLSRSDSMKELADNVWRKREDYANVILMICMMMMVVSSFYFAFTYDRDSGCEPDEGSVNVALFCFTAGLTSLTLAVIGCVMWYKRRTSEMSRDPKKKRKSDDNDGVGVGKIVLCLTFWNLVLAFFGFWMYCFQFDSACKSEAIAIFILIWSMSQFVLVFTVCSACCYLTYQVNVGSQSKAAEDVMGAGFTWTA